MNKNNFDVLRLGSALAVLISHSVPLTYGSVDSEVVYRLSRHQSTLGELAVAVFFVTSGFLITQSWQRRPDMCRFIWARVLRIYPGLIAVLTLTTFVWAPLVSTRSIGSYFSDPATFKYFLVNLSFVDFVKDLPGVFIAEPFSGAVNGSLWTLRYEAYCYLAVLGAGGMRMLNRWTVAVAWGAGCMACALWWVGKPGEMITLFMAGACLSLWRVPLDWRLALLSGFVLGGSLLTSGLRLALPTAGAYLVIYAAIGLKPIKYELRSDLSYGTYLWAFPVQQGVTAVLGPWANWALNIALSIPIVLGISWLSWNRIEAPALPLKNRMPFGRLVSPEEAPH